MFINRGLDKDAVYICSGILLGHEKNEIMPFPATWMDLEILTLTEVRQRKKKKSHDITFTWNLKYGTSEPSIKRETCRQREQTCGCQEGGGESGTDWEFGVSKCKLLDLKRISDEGLLYSPGNSIQSLRRDHDGR